MPATTIIRGYAVGWSGGNGVDCHIGQQGGQSLLATRIKPSLWSKIVSLFYGSAAMKLSKELGGSM